MSDYSVTLSTTEPNNYVGLIKLRQGDVDSQSIQATITENGQLFNFDHLSVFFNAVLPNGNVIRDKVTNVDYVNSKLSYVVADSFLQEVTQVTAWFSFENDEKIIDSTKNFQYSVIAGWKECIQQGNYIYELSEIQREIEEIIGNKDFSSLISRIDELKTDINFLDNQKATREELSEKSSALKMTIDQKAKALDDAKASKQDLSQAIASQDDKIANIVNGTPKGVYASLSDLNTALPSGASGIYVTSDNGHWWYWNGFWKDGGIYLADTSIVDYSGFTEKLNFIAGTYFDVVSKTEENLPDVISTDFIDLSEFNNFLYTEIFESRNHHAAFFDSNKNFISGVISSTVGEWVIPIPSEAKFAKIAFIDVEINNVYVKKSSEKNVMNHVNQLVNKLKKEIGTIVDLRILRGEYFNVSTKVNTKLNGVSSTDFVDISTFKGKLYTEIFESRNHHAAFFDSNKNFISGVISSTVGEWVIPIPSEAKFAKIAFIDVEEDVFYVRKMATDNIFEALPENYTLSLKGKKLGIIGDSISTYNGYIPTGYSPLYPANNVTSVDLTWWKQLINNTDMELCVNASWSGSTITGNQDDTTGSVGCSDARVNALTASNGNVPDIIIVYIGINDFGKSNGIVCGDYRGKTAISKERNITSISDAFGILLSKLQTKYPKAQIFVSRVMPEQYAGSMAESYVEGFPNINPTDNVSLPAFNEQLEEIASAFNCPVIPMDKAGITFFNVGQYTGDNLHPNATYMTMMAKIAQKTLEEHIR